MQDIFKPCIIIIRIFKDRQIQNMHILIFFIRFKIIIASSRCMFDALDKSIVVQGVKRIHFKKVNPSHSKVFLLFADSNFQIY